VKYLLDTSVFLWTAGAPDKMNKEAATLLSSRSSKLYLSAVSSWEIAIKSSINKLPLPEPARRFVPRMLFSTGIQSLPIVHTHALATADLPFYNTDPVDRMLVAQAQIEKMLLLTADSSIMKYDVETLWCRK